MSLRLIRLFPDTYLYSVLQMSGTRVMDQSAGITWASAAMGTAANIATLLERGFSKNDLNSAKPGDLFIAVEAVDEASAVAAATAAEQKMFSARAKSTSATDLIPKSLDEAMRIEPRSNIAIISLPGDYAALEANKALALGMDVLLFSDGISRADEIALKDHAAARERLVMGPGAGTAMLAHIGLAFANVVTAGPVGVVAAAGTGAQEVMSLLDRWGVGVSHVIGLGGRDLNEDINGRMARLAIAALKSDPLTQVILFVSKPPSPRVAAEVMNLAGDTPMVVAFMGIDSKIAAPAGVNISDTLEGGVVRTLELLGKTPPDTTGLKGPAIEAAISKLRPEQSAIHGLYSGGTLCYEALVLLGRTFDRPVYSNTPIVKSLQMPAPAGASFLLDLGEEEYTKGRPHPMIDPEARVEILEISGGDPSVAVIVMDVVLGHGSHPDPAGILAPICAKIMANGGPQIITYVLGTNGDPQIYSAQVAKLVAAGCIVTETAARAALVAGSIAARNPRLARLPL